MISRSGWFSVFLDNFKVPGAVQPRNIRGHTKCGNQGVYRADFRQNRQKTGQNAAKTKQ